MCVLNAEYNLLTSEDVTGQEEMSGLFAELLHLVMFWYPRGF